MNVTQFIDWLQKNVERPDETTIVVEIDDPYYDFDVKEENLYPPIDGEPHIATVTIDGRRC